MVRPVLIVSALILLAACGDTKDDWPLERPRIDQLRYGGQAPGDPLSLAFQIEFRDGNGDLGGGMLLLEIEGASRAQKALREIFEDQTPVLALDATEGEFEVVVKLDGVREDRFEVGFILRDAMGLESNDPTLILQAIE